jgi:hypothetical protein
MANTMRPAAWMGMGLVLGVVATSGWVHAQGGLVPGPRQDPRPGAARVLSGDEIGFRLQGVEGETPVVVPVIRRNGEWVEVALGGGGIRKLTR